MASPCDYYFKGRKLTYDQFRKELKGLPMSEIEEMFPTIKDEGISRLSWTTGEQQNDRYSLEKQVDEILYFPTLKEGVWDVSASKNDRQIWGEHADAKRIEAMLGKDIANKITKGEGEFLDKGNRTREDKYPIKSLRGDNLKVGGSQMLDSYGSPELRSQKDQLVIKKVGDKYEVGGKIFPHIKEAEKFKENYGLGIVGNVAKSLFKQEPKTIEIVQEAEKWELVIDGKVVETFPSEKAANKFMDEGEFSGIELPEGDYDMYTRSTGDYTEKTTQHSIDITPELKASVEGGQPLFKDAEAQYRIESGKNIVEAIKDFNGSPRATVALTHEIMHPTVVAIIDGAKEGNEAGVKHTKTIVNEFNKLNPKYQVTVEELIKGNDDFKSGTTSTKYRSVQEFIAKSWEKYHREGGRGFSEAFQKVLDQITKAFQSVYKSITGKQLTPELRKMFDEILGKGLVEQSLPTQEGKVENTPVNEKPQAGQGAANEPPAIPPTSQENQTGDDSRKELDYLANNVKTIGGVSKYFSGDTIFKYTGEEAKNEQKIITQDLISALESGVDIINKAKEVFGENYVEKTLDYIEKSTANVSNKALMYVSLENAVNKDKLLYPERVEELNKQIELVYTESQAYLREASLAINMGRLRRFAKVGYNMEQVTDNFFSTEELEARGKVVEAVQVNMDKINEEALLEIEQLKERVTELEGKVKNKGLSPAKIERRIKLADKLDKVADNILAFGRVSGDIKRNSFAPDIQKLVSDAIKYVAEEIRNGGEIPEIIINAAKRFANEKLTPDFLKTNIKKTLKESGFTEREITKTKEEIDRLEKEKVVSKELKDETGLSPKELVTEALIKNGFGRTVNIKGEKRDVLDWKKLAGREGSSDKIMKHIEDAVKDMKLSPEVIANAKDAIINEVTRLRESIITKSLTELNRKNKTPITPEQRSAAQRLSELYTLGLFEKNENEFDNALNKAVGINLTESNYTAAKEIAKALETIYVNSFKGVKLNDITAKTAIDKLNDKLRLLLIDETKKQGNGILRASNLIRTYFDIQQTMILVSMKQTLENPISGLEASVLEFIGGKLSKEGIGGKGMSKQRWKVMRAIVADMVMNGGMGYGDVENLFVNRAHLDDWLNKQSDSKIFHTIASTLSGRLTLNSMDAMFKFSITEKKFTNNLIKILTDKTNPKRMELEDAKTFVTEQLTGQTLEDATVTAREVMNQINSEAGKELIKVNEESVIRFANDIVKSALEMGGKLSADQIKAAYNAVYRAAGLNIGHVANNPLSEMVQTVSSRIENKITQAIKNKEWTRAAILTQTSILFRNFMNPFVGGGSNWLVISVEKTGLGLFTGLLYKAATRTRIDMSTEAGMKHLEKTLFNQSRVKDKYMRGAVGGAASLLVLLAFYGVLDEDDRDAYRKWRLKNMWAARYFDVLSPQTWLLLMAINNKKLDSYLSNSFNMNSAMDAETKILKAAKYASQGDKGKALGALGESIGTKLNTPLPWRLVKDGMVIYQGVKGEDPYHGNYKPSVGFWRGAFQGGAVEFLGLRPEEDIKAIMKKRRDAQEPKEDKRTDAEIRKSEKESDDYEKNLRQRAAKENERYEYPN